MARYDRKTYHMPHLFCCPGDNVLAAANANEGGTSSGSPHRVKGCHAEIFLAPIVDARAAEADRAKVVIGRVDGPRGDACFLWQNTVLFDEDVGMLGRWEEAHGRAPDLLLVKRLKPWSQCLHPRCPCLTPQLRFCLPIR
jgi:hypothetical protein